MAKRLSSSQRQFKQKRLFIFLLVGIYFLICSILASIYFFVDRSVPGLETTLLLLLIGLTFVLVWARQSMIPIQMYLHYYRMLDEQLPPFIIQSPIQSKAFLNNLDKYQFQLETETKEFQLFARVYDRLPWVARTQSSLIFIVLIKDQSITITDERLESVILQYKTNLKLKKEIQNELTLLFYQAPFLTEELKEKTQRIINFSLQNRGIITIPCLQIGETKIYALRPRRLFPNKFYYVLIKLLYYLTDANEML
jgi:hypothetical protein